MKMKKFWNGSNKGVILSSFLLASFLIGFVIYVGFTPNVAADPCPGDGCITTVSSTIPVTTVPECECDEDCDDSNPCTDDTCVDNHCVYENNEYEEHQPCGYGQCEGTKTRTCSGGSFGPWSDCSTYEDQCDDCDPGPDCIIDEYTYTIDVWINGAWYCDEEGICQDECIYDHFCLDDDYGDGSYTFGCGAECDGYGEECPNYCAEPEIRYIGYCDLWPGDCTCHYDTEDCDEYDGWYCYDDWRKYEDWYCEPEDCDYEITDEEDCNNYDCTTGIYCVGEGTNTLEEWGDDYTCMNDGDAYCDIDDTMFCYGPWVCDESRECEYQGCGGSTYQCYMPNPSWTWGTPPSTETACEDGYDNDCDGLVDCDDPDCHLPPITTKWYEPDPYEDDGAEWINSEYLVGFNVHDEDVCEDEEFTTYWRNTIVDDMYCWDDCEEAEGSGEWNVYYEPFNKPDESCHLIEYYSVNGFGHQEEPHKQCVFVDNTGPTPIKEVGDPKTACQGSQCDDWDWLITLLTPITLDCDDQGDHPVGEEILCYKIYYDGEDKTEEYCDNGMDDGYCCIEPPLENFMFEKECSHRIEFYCIDKLDNEGPIDDETFKVEGGVFTIQLNKKWNLISVPFVLLNDDPAEIFDGVAGNMDAIWTYDGETDEWYVYTTDGDPDTLHHIIPGWGYWVKMYEYDELLLGGSLFKPRVTPPIRGLVSGWNLIGYYGTDGETVYDEPDGDGKEAYCALYSLVNTNSGLPQWSSLVTYWEPDNPNQWYYLGQYDNMDPGAGYWLEMGVEDNYAPATVCPD